MTESHVSTGCQPLDDLLGGGLERGQVTQLYGSPGSGKTNVALSTAVQVADAGGTAVYIDTEGVSVERFRQILDANADNPDDAAGNVIIEAAHDFAEQAEAVRDASDFAEQADLVVVDSITGFYRLERASDAEGGDSLREVARQVTHLLSLARKHDLAVLVTNQVYSDPDAGTDTVRPLGGHTLMHWTGVVVRMERYKGNRRRAILEKHGAKPEGERVNLAITDRGLETPS